MMTRRELLANPGLLRDKAFGALIGLAIGDSLGDQARQPEQHERWGITMDLHADNSWSTDDTEFALMTANWLIKDHNNLCADTLVEHWHENLFDQNDLGSKGGESEIAAVANLKRGILPPYSGMYNSGYLSDGAAMRVTPIGVYCAGEPERAADLAAIDASISHYLDGVWGAQAVAASVAVAMVDGSVDEIIAAGLRCIPPQSWLGDWLTRAFAIVDEKKDIFTAWDDLHRQLWMATRSCNPEALAETYALFKLTEGDFRRGVIFGGNFGRDADTIAAIIGAFAGARCGAGALPQEWVQKARFPSGRCIESVSGLDIAKVADDMAAVMLENG